MKGFLLALAPRAVGAVASLAAGWIFAKSHGSVQLDPTQVAELAATMIGTYAIAHPAARPVVDKAVDKVQSKP